MDVGCLQTRWGTAGGKAINGRIPCSLHTVVNDIGCMLELILLQDQLFQFTCRPECQALMDKYPHVPLSIRMYLNISITFS